MKISDQQLIMLITNLRDTLRIHDGAGIFTFEFKVRQELWSEIMTQQSNRIIEVGEDNVGEGEQKPKDKTNNEGKIGMEEASFDPAKKLEVYSPKASNNPRPSMEGRRYDPATGLTYDENDGRVSDL